MSTSVMTERIAEASPRSLARTAGVFQLLEAVTATFGQVIVLGRFVVSGNVAATAANILGHERLYWLGFASCLIGVVFHIGWALLLYDLLKPVNGRLSLFAAFVILVGCAIQALASLLYLAPLLVLKAGSSAFTPEQLQALAFMFLKLNAYAYDIYLVFFGLWCVLIGVLIFRSTFLPRILGFLLAISGLGWMIYPLTAARNSSVHPLHRCRLRLRGNLAAARLLVFGVNTQRWNEQASAAPLGL